ncbi:MAG: hypothetical protein QM621_14625 [Aeromicrobium sp.]|uniref:hypothetical protein n=1 Tax=Aeromicrobium sp. TaxID=1871063 RepID=UPI0039E61902
MFSPRDQDAVLTELGSKFPAALITATNSARNDLDALREWRPGWVLAMFQREVAGFIHSRIWDHLTTELDSVDGITFRTAEPHREATVSTPLGRSFKIRVKRHSEGDQISSYPTISDLEFWGGASISFEGLEQISLAAGYRWDSTLGQIGAPVLSYREGKENVIWAVEVDAGEADGLTPITYTPILPDLPRIDLADALADESRTGGRSS